MDIEDIIKRVNIMSKNKKRQKSKDMLRHVKSKFYKRYNIDLTDEMHRELVMKIQNNEGTLVDKQSNRVSAWEIEYKDKTMTVIYDKIRSMLVTVLPEGADINDRYLYDNKLI